MRIHTQGSSEPELFNIKPMYKMLKAVIYARLISEPMINHSQTFQSIDSVQKWT